MGSEEYVCLGFERVVAVTLLTERRIGMVWNEEALWIVTLQFSRAQSSLELNLSVFQTHISRPQGNTPSQNTSTILPKPKAI